MEEMLPIAMLQHQWPQLPHPQLHPIPTPPTATVAIPQIKDLAVDPPKEQLALGVEKANSRCNMFCPHKMVKRNFAQKYALRNFERPTAKGHAPNAIMSLGKEHPIRSSVPCCA